MGSLPEEMQKVYDCLDVYPVDIETIIVKTEMSAARVSELLLRLEIEGLVESLPGKQYKSYG